MKVLTLALVLLTTPACADWQFTRWGMSEPEVKAAAKGETTVYRDPKIETPEFTTPFIGSYKSNGLDFTVYYRFRRDTGGLNRVRIATGLAVCGKLTSQLSDIYGKPDSQDYIDQVMLVRTWRDVANGNKVVFRSMVKTACEIDYEPLSAPGVKGGL